MGVAGAALGALAEVEAGCAAAVDAGAAAAGLAGGQIDEVGWFWQYTQVES